MRGYYGFILAGYLIWLALALGFGLYDWRILGVHSIYLPAVVFVVIGNIAVYLLAASPLMPIYKWKTSWRWLLLPLTATSIYLLATLPAAVAQKQFNNFKSTFLSEDFSSPAQVSDIVVRLPLASFQRVPTCDDRCQTLLYIYGVRAVVSANTNTPGNATRYAIQKMDRCKSPPPTFDIGVQQRMALGECITGTKGTSDEANVVVEYLYDRDDVSPSVADTGANKWKLWVATSSGKINIYERHDGQLVLAEHRTALTGRIASAPFHFTINGQKLPYTNEVSRSTLIVSAIDALSLLRERYSLEKIAHPELTVDQRISIAKHILKAQYDPDDLITSIETHVIQDVLKIINVRNMHADTYASEDTDFMRLVLKQKALVSPISLGEGAGKNLSGALQTLLPDLIARLEAPISYLDPVTHRDHFRFYVANTIASMPTSLLVPYKERLVALVLNENLSLYVGPLLSHLDKFAAAPEPILLEAANRPGPQTEVLRALCGIASPGNTKIAAVFVRYLSEPTLDSGNGAYAAILGLMKIGAAAELEQFELKSRGLRTFEFSRARKRYEKLGTAASCR